VIVRWYDPMLSRRPSAAMRVAAPEVSWPAASNRTIQLVTSSVIVFTAIASGPGLMVPVTALPSHAMTIVTCVRLAVAPQSPDHVPVSG